MRLPFGYELRITKRNIAWMKDNKLVSFADWLNGAVTVCNTPITEEIYSTIASEFAKIDLGHVIDKKNVYKRCDSNLDYILSERPNALQNKYDFLFTLAYQLYKYGNAICLIKRDRKGNATAFEPIDVTDYEMGNGYQVSETDIYIKMRNKRTNSIELIPYENLVHLRLNPNNIFNGDASGVDGNRVFVDVIDNALQSLLSELKNNGTVRGVIKIGESGIGYSNGFANRALAGKEEKINKQKEIVDRIKATKGGILVLDAGETWQSLDSPFKTVSNAELDQYIDMLLAFNGINKKVVNGTASEDEMEVFFNKTIVPRIEQFISEMNYKVFTKTARSQGNRIEYYRNPFEYVSITKAIDIAYKGMQDTTTNERRRMIYHLPPIDGGDILLTNKNFAVVGKDTEETLKES